MNEDPTDALIRELKEQNEKLKAQLASGVVTDDDVKDFGGEDDENLSPAGEAASKPKLELCTGTNPGFDSLRLNSI